MVECSESSFTAVNGLLAPQGFVAASYTASKDRFELVEKGFVIDMGAVDQRNIFFLPAEKLPHLPLGENLR